MKPMTWHVLMRTALGNLFALNCLLQTTSFCTLVDLPGLCPVIRWIYIISIVYLCIGSWSQLKLTLLHKRTKVLSELHCPETCPNLNCARWLYALYLLENVDEAHKYACS